MASTFVLGLGLTLTFFLVLLQMVPSRSFGESHRLASKCGDTGSNLYGFELRGLLSGMVEIAGKRSFYATNTSSIGLHGRELIFGSYLCRGDISPIECKDCVSKAIVDLHEQCRNSKEAVTWSETCMVRYSDRTFLGIVVEDESVYKWSKLKVVSDQKAYLNMAGSLIQSMSEEFYTQTDIPDSTNKYFGYKFATLPDSYVKVYTMAQCTPDLTPYDCRMCLQILTDDIPALCSGRMGCWMLNPSCNAHYDGYPFSNTLPPSPPPSHEHSNVPAKSFKRKRSLVLRIVIPLSIGLAILILSSLIYLQRKRREATRYGGKDDFDSLRSMAFSYASVKRATHNFAKENKLGQGGFGEVYKGKLPNGEEVAIKRLARNSKQGIDEFKNEVTLLARLQHKNVVKLVGFCKSEAEKVLIFEFLPNSSLDRVLFGPKTTTLEWETRFQIIVGVAKAVLYLHEDSRFKIIHRDLKPSNILLDHQMNPKVADLGLARLFDDDRSQSTTKGIVGTPGYMAPEYTRQGIMSAKSDMYSFGVVILETVSGQRNGFADQQQNDDEGLIPRAWRLWTEQTALDLLDPSLLDYPQEQVKLCIWIALLCIQEEASQRPTMMSVVAALNGNTAISLPPPTVPRCFATVSTTEPTSDPTMASILATLREESLLVPEIQNALD